MMNLLAAILLGSIVASRHLDMATAAISGGANAKHFGILCDIYNVAAGLTDSWSIERTIKATESEIDVINASLSDDAWFSEVLKANSPSDLSEKFKSKNEEIAKYWSRWKVAVDSTEKETKYKKLPSAAVAVKVAQFKIRKIEEQMERALAGVKLNNTEDLAKIRGNFDGAIYGDGKTDVDEADKSLYVGTGASRVAACGNPKDVTPVKGQSAGKSLIMDFLCLCGYLATNGVGTVCSHEMDLQALAWDPSKGASGVESWRKIKEECLKRKVANSNTVQAGFRALAAFRAGLQAGTQATAAKWRTGLLGKCDGDDCNNNGCSGTGANVGNHGICIYYGENSAKETDEIKWFKSLETGLSILNQTEYDYMNGKSITAYIKMLRSRAEEIYEEAKARVELESSSREPSTPISKEKENLTSRVITQEAANANGAATPRFLLPWALLI